MAYEPCEACGAPFRGKSSLVYPSILQGSERLTRRVRLCPAHFRDYVDRMGRQLVTNPFNQDGQLSLPSGCNWCGDVSDGLETDSIFLTAYGPSGARQDFAGRVCGQCTGRAAASMLLDAA